MSTTTYVFTEKYEKYPYFMVEKVPYLELCFTLICALTVDSDNSGGRLTLSLSTFTMLLSGSGRNRLLFILSSNIFSQDRPPPEASM